MTDEELIAVIQAWRNTLHAGHHDPMSRAQTGVPLLDTVMERLRVLSGMVPPEARTFERRWARPRKPE